MRPVLKREYIPGVGESEIAKEKYLGRLRRRVASWRGMEWGSWCWASILRLVGWRAIEGGAGVEATSRICG